MSTGFEAKVVKNGQKLRVIIKMIDKSLPACRIEGNQYLFNSDIVESFDLDVEKDISKRLHINEKVQNFRISGELNISFDITGK